MTTKELLKALQDGKKITKKTWENTYIQFEDDQLYYYLGDNSTPIKLTDLGGYGSDDEFEIRLLTNQEKTFLQSLLNSLKEKNKVRIVTVSASYISYEDGDGADIYYLQRNDLNLKFEGLECYHEYTLGELGLYDK